MYRFKSLLFVIVILLFATPVARAHEYESEIGTMWYISVSKQVKRFNFSVQQHVWTLSDHYERYMSIAGISYTLVPKYVKLNALYYYINQQPASKEVFFNRHRYQVGATFSYPIQNLSLTLSSRFESTYTIGLENPVNKWRNRLLFNYNIPNSRWTPFIQADLFLFTNGAKAWDMERVWYDAGVECRIDRKNSIEFRVREEHRITKTPQQWNTHFSLGYKLKL